MMRAWRAEVWTSCSTMPGSAIRPFPSSTCLRRSVTGPLPSTSAGFFAGPRRRREGKGRRHHRHRFRRRFFADRRPFPVMPGMRTEAADLELARSISGRWPPCRGRWTRRSSPRGNRVPTGGGRWKRRGRVTKPEAVASARRRRLLCECFRPVRGKVRPPSSGEGKRHPNRRG